MRDGIDVIQIFLIHTLDGMKWSLALFFTCFFSSFSAQETFLQKNLYTLWERDGKEINFLLSSGVSNSFAGIEDPKKFTFGFTYEAIDES
ncbi:MAG TPA: hypothetical protein DCF87_09230, partial [Opitutae bacterium]|nr:hypothetical protein [Opitutae bacterium]